MVKKVVEEKDKNLFAALYNYICPESVDKCPYCGKLSLEVKEKITKANGNIDRVIFKCKNCNEETTRYKVTPTKTKTTHTILQETLAI